MPIPCRTASSSSGPALRSTSVQRLCTSRTSKTPRSRYFAISCTRPPARPIAPTSPVVLQPDQRLDRAARRGHLREVERLRVVQVHQGQLVDAEPLAALRDGRAHAVGGVVAARRVDLRGDDDALGHAAGLDAARRRCGARSRRRCTPFEVSMKRIGLSSAARTVATPSSAETSRPNRAGMLPSGPPPRQTAETCRPVRTEVADPSGLAGCVVGLLHGAIPPRSGPRCRTVRHLSVSPRS